MKFLLILAGSVIFCIQYVKYLPYYDNFASVMFGFCCFFMAWVGSNAILTFIITLSGHFVVIVFGIIPIYILTKNIKLYLLENIIQTHPDKTSSEVEAVLQCYSVYALTTEATDPVQEANLIALVALHKKECVDPECPLSKPNDLYDSATGKHVKDNDTENLHKNKTYLKHFTKFYFDSAIANYGNTSGVRIAYASFLFFAFKNAHTALTELNYAKKNKPSFTQITEIFKLE